MRNDSIKKYTVLAMFLALATLLNYVENLLPVLIPLPGVKLGLANTINLVILYFFGRKEYFTIGFLRVLLIGVMFTGLFSMNFLFSICGFLLSSLAVIFFNYFKQISIYSLSVTSAIFHSIGQILIGMFMIDFAIISYLPILVLSSFIASIFIAYITSNLIKKLERLSLFD